MYCLITWTMYCLITLITLIEATTTKISCTETLQQKDEHRPSICIVSKVFDSNFTNDYEFSERWIKTLKFTECEITDLPLDLFPKFFNLRTLEGRGCGLKDLNRSSFNKGSQLFNLDISHGAYTELRAQVFVSLTNLKSLNASYSRLQEIHVTAFVGLSKLIELTLSHNKISGINNEVLEPLSNLEVLDLSYNQMEVLDSELFIYNPKLKILKCEGNGIILVEKDFLNPEAHLRILVLSNNYLTSINLTGIKSDAVEINNNNLTILELGSGILQISASNNYLKSVKCPSESKTINLNLSFNYFKELGCIEKLSSLIFLDLSHNNLQDLEIDDFSALTNLKNLTLKANKIKYLPQGVLSHQNQLEFLDISYNNLQVMPLSVLLSAVNLQTLYIDGNKITDLDYENIKNAFPSLKTIGLGDNGFNCSFLGKFILYLNKHKVLPVSSGLKELNSTNFNGIKCNMTNTTVRTNNQAEDSIRVDNFSSLSYRIYMIVEQIGSIESRLLKLNDDLIKQQTYNLESQLSSLPNTDNNEKILSLVRKLGNLTSSKQKVYFDFLYRMLNDTKLDMEQIKTASGLITKTSSPEDFHRISTEVTLIRNLFIVISAAVFTIICYLLSKKLLKELPRLRQYTSQPTVDGSVELNSSRDQSPRRV